MVWGALLVSIAIAGCGRLSFDQTARGDAGGDADTPDAAADALTFPSGLVAYYPMESNLDDAIGSHDAVCGSCPTYVVGKRGMAARFAMPNLAEAPSAADLEGPEVTVALWLRAVSAPGFMCPFQKRVGALDQNSWQLCLNASLTINMSTSNGTNISTLLSPTSPFPVGEWHHIVLRAGPAGRSIWIDGVNVAGVGPSTMGRDAGNVVIGADIDGVAGGFWFYGDLDEVQIYNRALLDSEIPPLATP